MGKPRGRGARLAMGVVGALLGLELLWLILAQAALNTGFLRARLNAAPEELWFDWRSGWSWFPGRLELQDVRVRGQDERDQWYGEVDRADLAVSVGALFGRRIEGRRSRLEGVVFRLRPRLDAVPPGSVSATNLPAIPGFSNPPEKAPVVVTHAAHGKPWVLMLPRIEVAGLRELWINEDRLAGAGGFEGRLDYEIRGPFRAEVFRLGLHDGALQHRGALVATNLVLDVRGVLGPTVFREDRGMAILKRLTAELGVKSELLTCGLLDRHIGTTNSLGLNGPGTMDARLHLAGGRLLPPGRIRVDSPKLGVRLERVEVQGAAEIRLEVGGTEQAPTSTLDLQLRRLRLRHATDETEAAEAGELRLRATAFDPWLPEGFREVALDLDLGPLQLPDARVLNGFLPVHLDGRFERGEIGVRAGYRRTRGGEGKGDLEVQGEALDFRLGMRDLAGQLVVRTEFAPNLTNHQVRLANTLVLVTNVTVSGVRNRQSDGWHARVEVKEGRVAWDKSDLVEGTVAVALCDLRPLLALLREGEDSPGWAKWVPNLKDLKGGAGIRVDAQETSIRDLHLRGAATEILGQLRLREGGPDGIVYARYGLISAALDLRQGGRDWTWLGAKRAYRRMAEELGVAAKADEDQTEGRGE